MGTIEGNAIFTIKNTETIPLKPAESVRYSNYCISGIVGGYGIGGPQGGHAINGVDRNGNDPSSVLF